MYTVICTVGAWLIADVLTGIIHWWQDHYLVDDSPYKIFATISKDNTRHHNKPEAMGQLSIWENLSSSAPFGLSIALILFLMGFHYVVWLTFFFASFGNLVHRFAHVPKNKVPVAIQWLQMTGLFISPKHHSAHHRQTALVAKEDSNIRFCPMTNWMNPVLDTVKFFRGLEYLLSKIGIHAIKKW